MAYLNFQNCTRQEYEDTLYSQDARNKIKILFNNVELENADLYCEKFTVKPRIIPNGAKVFSLNNFISKEAELILHDIDINAIQDQVTISIGTLVNNTYEYVPIGIFNIQDQPTTDKNKTTIKLRDNSVKFDFNYNAQTLIEANNGSATKLQILQDICTQANVTCNITSFIGYLDEIGVYDNTVTARQYIANIAEQAGKIATINRSGELIFIDLNNLTTWQIPIGVVEKYEEGTSFKIGKVVYEDGIVRYETPDSNDDTLFLDGSNNYINGELVKEQASSNANSYSLTSTGDNADLAKFELEGKTTQASTPSPSSPSELVSVGYKNLADIEDFTGIAEASSVYYTLINSIYLEAGTYTLSWTQNNSMQSNTRNTPQLLLSTGGSVLQRASNTANYNLNAGRYSWTFEISSANNYKLSYWVHTFSVDTSFSDFVLTKDAEQHSYIPYNKYGIEVKTIGKNLFDKSAVKEGMAIDRNTGQELTSSSYASYSTSDYCFVKPSTQYYLGIAYSSSYYGIVFYDINKNYLSGQQATRTFTTPANTYYIRFTWVTANYDKNTIQLEQGSTATTYEAYKENTYLYTLDNPLRAIGNYKDKLYIKNGYLYVERKVGNVVLDENSSITKSSATPMFRYYFAVPNKVDTSRTLLMNSHFPIISNYGTDITGMFGGGSSETGRIWFQFASSNTDKDTLAKLQTWLTTNNVEVSYAMKTPVIEELGEIELPRTYKGTTHIDINSNIDTNSYIQYRKDKTQLEAILEEVDEFDIDSFKTGKILGNPAIDGYDLIQIHDKSKNLFSSEMEIGGINNNTGANSTETNRIRTKDYIEVLPNTTYVLQDDLNYNLLIYEYNQNKEFIQYTGQFLNPKTWTTTANTHYIRVRTGSGYVPPNMKIKYQLELGSIPTDYVPYKDEIYTTIATSDLTYNGVITNSFDTQIGQEAKEQNVTIKGEATFQKWARTQIDNVEGTINLQAGQINDTNNRINETNLQISSQGALLNVIANNSNIDIQYDAEGNPLNGEVREVTTTTGFTFNAEGMTIQDSSSNFKAQHRNTGTYYKDGNNIVGQYTKDGSKQKDLELFGVYYYGKDDIDDDPMFVAQLFTDANGEECFGHFYNRGD